MCNSKWCYLDKVIYTQCHCAGEITKAANTATDYSDITELADDDESRSSLTKNIVGGVLLSA